MGLTGHKFYLQNVGASQQNTGVKGILFCSVVWYGNAIDCTSYFDC